jgi:RNA polymerase sigma factor (TIGR02999 family)
MSDSEEVTNLLRQLSAGRREAFDELFPILYAELRGLAHVVLSGERRDHTLGTTGLVHEAYLRLVRIERIDWNDRGHFFAIAARAMRRVLVDYAKARKREKRGGGAVVHLPLEAAAEVSVDPEEILMLEDALNRLQAMNERHARVVELRVFTGLTIEETAEALGVSPASVKRDWALSRAWLNRALSGGDEAPR